MTRTWKRWLSVLLAGMLLLGVLSGCSDSGQSGGESNAPSGYAEQMLELVNEQRAKAGVAPLQLHARLCEAADARAKETMTLFSHTRPDGSSCFTILDEYGISYGWAGENILQGTSSPAQAVSLWMTSPGHRANILKPEYKYLGVGKASTYWVQLFMS